MKCPNCNVNLMMTERNAVEIDYCPECRGVWMIGENSIKLLKGRLSYRLKMEPG